jgi:hypothetical protein
MSTLSSQVEPTALPQWLHCLATIMPPKGLLHVGAGPAGTADSHKLHGMYGFAKCVLALDADEEHVRVLQSAQSNTPHVRVQQALVAAAGGPTAFVRTSIATEAGLCRPEALHPVWPRLAALGEDELQAVALSDCWQRFAARAEDPELDQPNWLFVECLPAAELLRCSPTLLKTVDVVAARGVDETMLPPGSSLPSGLGLQELQTVLQSYGLELVGTQEEMHPALVLAVFARKPAHRDEQNLRRIGEQSESLAALGFAQRAAEESAVAAHQRAEHLRDDLAATAAKLEVSARERDRQAQIAEENAGEIDRLRQELAESRSAAALLNQQATKENEDLRQIAVQQESRMDELVRSAQALGARTDEARLEAARVAADLRVQLDAARDDALALKAALEETKQSLAERDQQLSLAAEASARRAGQAAQQEVRITELSQSVERDSQEREALSQLLKDKGDEVHVVQMALEEARGHHEHDQQQIGELSKARDELVGEQQELHRQLAEVAEVVTTLKAALDEANQSLAGREQQLRLGAEASERSAEHAAQQEVRIIELSQSAERDAQEREALSQLLKDKEDEVHVVQMALEEARGHHEHDQQQIGELAKSRDELAGEKQELHRQLAEVAEVVTTLKGALDETKQSLAEREQQLRLGAEASERRAEQAVQQEARLTALTQSAAGDAKEREALGQRLQEKVGEVQAIQRALEEARLDKDRNRQQVAELTKLRDELAQIARQHQDKLDQAARTRTELDAKLASQHEQLQERTQREDALRQELRDARQTAALSMKLQTLRESDLRELQSRYESSAETQEKQQLLLRKLSERLTAASSYFHQIAQEKPQLAVIAAKAAPKKAAVSATAAKRRPPPARAAKKPNPPAKKARSA